MSEAKFLPDAAAGFRVRGICQYGPGHAGAKDGYVYVYFGMNRGTDVFLGRVSKDAVFDAGQYRWFHALGADGSAIWAETFAEWRPVFRDPRRFVWHLGISYNPGLNRYLLSKPHYSTEDDPEAADAADSRVSSIGIFDAPTPWGPWTTVYYKDDFKDGLVKFSYFIPPKFISEDGKTFWLAWSGGPEYDNLNLVRAEFQLPLDR